MKECGKTIEEKVKAVTLGLTNQSISEPLSMMFLTEMVSLNKQMGRFTMDLGLRDKSLEIKVLCVMLMEAHTLESG